MFARKSEIPRPVTTTGPSILGSSRSISNLTMSVLIMQHLAQPLLLSKGISKSILTFKILRQFYGRQ